MTLKSTKNIPIYPIVASGFSRWLKKQDIVLQNWIASINYAAKPGTICLVPDASGHLASVLCGVNDENDFWSVGQLPLTLPDNAQYSISFSAFSKKISAQMQARFQLAWDLGSYQFTRYKKPSRSPAKLHSMHTEATVLSESIYLVRDLINTPADDMGPSELAHAAEKLAKQCNATFHQTVGKQLLEKKFNAIHTVGRASDDAPRLLDIVWGKKSHPKVTLVGKGVCFDSGGLDLKPSSYMLLMKKDMGGAANVLGLARAIMQSKLPIRLRVLIPAVENAVSGSAYRPGDIITMRSGKTVEIGNTDAEGRLVLADALTEAVSESPDLLIDMATLTGAARVAVGTELVAFFSNNDAIAQTILKVGDKEADYLCRLPLFASYRDGLNSTIADINNMGADGYAGAIQAALFLKEFVPDEIPWLHLDMMAWNTRSRPGRPVGGEAMGVRALFAYLRERFC
ncbi:MAG: leucyl aminopeptidase family protein [Gammaproteobacteria bacterium]|nr:leucyl aminopeptidase family protein [Gammaproteobacteria bacterium]